ncbi:Homoisocitrate dehydrogenase [Grifola frondosa]|uniref:Homoisocitrate dehydrogenase n=1 Tax=Grifola frondosa TaxID=5627 RepID=A0A1C7MMP9_GRIFR|nr:Homoisocitrate dehydrogenase [Grifola frondosa]
MATAARQALKIGLVPADGIGHEVIPAAQSVIEALGSDIPKPVFVPLLAGFELFTRTGTALPEDTVEALKECDCALFGAVSSPSKGSPATLISVAATPNGKPAVDLVVVRENTECLYVKDENIISTPHGREARATRLITERASRRIGKMAFEIALGRPRQQVTIIHKSNVLSVTDGLFRETVRAVPRLPETVLSTGCSESLKFMMSWLRPISTETLFPMRLRPWLALWALFPPLTRATNCDGRASARVCA